MIAIHFEGFWQCRMATDPDPTREPRGTSGYTVATATEPSLDRKIRTQLDQIPAGCLRQPFPPYLQDRTDRFGVFVTGVDGAPQAERRLVGAAVRLLDEPEFELRNQIVGDGINRIAPPIVPFHLAITRGEHTLLQRADPLSVRHPDKEIWQLRPGAFTDRVPRVYRHLSDEVVETIFPGDPRAANSIFVDYFAHRKQWLQSRLTAPTAHTALEQAGFQSRAQMIDAFSGQDTAIGLIENRLGLQCIWEHEIRGDSPTIAPLLRGRVCEAQPWTIRFWMGGWDGDLMVGYCKGTLTLPSPEQQPHPGEQQD